MPAPIATPIAMSSSAPFDPQRRSHRELPIANAAVALTNDIDMLPVAVESKTSFVPLHIDTGWNCTNCHCVNESMATICLECNLSRKNQDVTDVAVTDTDDDVAISVEDVPTSVRQMQNKINLLSKKRNKEYLFNGFCSPVGFIFFILYPILVVYYIINYEFEQNTITPILFYISSVLFVLWIYAFLIHGHIFNVGYGRFICTGTIKTITGRLEPMSIASPINDTSSTETWKPFLQKIVTTDLKLISAVVKWEDQGFGNSKGGIRFRIIRDGVEIRTFSPFGVAPKKFSTKLVTFEGSNSLLYGEERQPGPMLGLTTGDIIVSEYKVGGGGGHTLYIESFTANFRAA